MMLGIAALLFSLGLAFPVGDGARDYVSVLFRTRAEKEDKCFESSVMYCSTAASTPLLTATRSSVAVGTIALHRQAHSENFLLLNAKPAKNDQVKVVRDEHRKKKKN